MYGEFSIYGNANGRLRDPDCVMTTQPFDEFLATFTATIAPLQLREQQEISHLPRIISPRLRWQTMNGIKRTSFQAYFQQLRQCDLNRRLADREQQRLGTRHVSEEDQGYGTDESSMTTKKKKDVEDEATREPIDIQKNIWNNYVPRANAFDVRNQVIWQWMRMHLAREREGET